MNSIRYNVSKTYLLPLLSEVIDIDPKFISYLDNTYMFDTKGKHQNCFFLYHKFDFKNPEFTKYENKLTSNSLFVELVDKGEFVIYVFKFPEEYLREYDLLKESKYSEFGNDAKELIVRFWTSLYGKTMAGTRVIRRIKQILEKDAILRREIESTLSTEKSPVILEDNSELGEHVYIGNEMISMS